MKLDLLFALLVAVSNLQGQPKQAQPSALKLIRDNCVKCHSGAKPPNGLKLDTVDNMVRGGKRGPAVVPYKPDESLIYLSLYGAPGAVWNSKGFMIMPPGDPVKLTGRLTTAEIETIRKWIAAGAQQFSMSGQEP